MRRTMFGAESLLFAAAQHLNGKQSYCKSEKEDSED